MSRLSRRIKHIYQNEGLLPLLKRLLPFLVSLIPFEYHNFYIFERHFEQKLCEADFLPKVDNLAVKIISTIEQLNELPKEGFDLSLLDMKKVRDRLGKGAMLYIAFVGSKLAYTGWSALNDEAKNSFNPYPFSVDFENGVVFGGDTWTNPVYRRLGIHKYVGYIREGFLKEKGVIKIKHITLSTNILGQRATSFRGGGFYAKARYLRIFGLKFWKETLLS